MSDTRQWTVLLVDDSEDDRYLFTYSFRTAAIPGRIVESEDGEAAIQSLQQALRPSADPSWPDVMFLDLKMPRCDGFEVLAWLKEKRKTLPLEVYVLSGSSERADIERSKELGAQDYITKPITREKLQQLFKAWASRRADAS